LRRVPAWPPGFVTCMHLSGSLTLGVLSTRPAQPHAIHTPTPRLVASMIPPQGRALLSRALGRVYQQPSSVAPRGYGEQTTREVDWVEIEIHNNSQSQAVGCGPWPKQAADGASVRSTAVEPTQARAAAYCVHRHCTFTGGRPGLSLDELEQRPGLSIACLAPASCGPSFCNPPSSAGSRLWPIPAPISPIAQVATSSRRRAGGPGGHGALPVWSLAFSSVPWKFLKSRAALRFFDAGWEPGFQGPNPLNFHPAQHASLGCPDRLNP